MKGERRFAFIPVALPHCISLLLHPTLSLSLSLLPFPPHSVFLFFLLSFTLSLSPLSSVSPSHISHQCPLWSNWASHKALELLAQPLSLTFMEMCCFHATVQVIQACLQVQVSIQSYLFLLKCRPIQNFFLFFLPSLSFSVVLHVGSNVLQIPEQTPLLSNQRLGLCSPATASASIFYFGKFAVTCISTIRGKFLLEFPSSTRGEGAMKGS